MVKEEHDDSSDDDSFAFRPSSKNFGTSSQPINVTPSFRVKDNRKTMIGTQSRIFSHRIMALNQELDVNEYKLDINCTYSYGIEDKNDEFAVT